MAHHGLRALFSVAVALAVGAINLSAQALITTGSFETGTSPPGNMNYTTHLAGSTDITGWTVISTPAPALAPLAWLNGDLSGVVNNAFKASDGTFFLDLTGFSDDASTFGGVQQSFATTNGQLYQAKFDLITGNGNSIGPVGATLTVGPASQTFTTSATPSLATTYTLNFTANSTSTTLSILGASTPLGGWFLGVDNVAVTAIPEPAECAGFAGLIVLAAAVYVRHRSRRGRSTGVALFTR